MSVDAKELRIGNFIFDKDKELIYPNEGIREVSALDKEICFHVRRDENGVSYSGNTYDRIDPIPLTIEILEKCGFELESHDYKWFLLIDCPFKIFYDLEQVCYDSLLLDVRIPYLHQLQNLYFALTGTEINLTL